MNRRLIGDQAQDQPDEISPSTSMTLDDTGIAPSVLDKIREYNRQGQFELSAELFEQLAATRDLPAAFYFNYASVLFKLRAYEKIVELLGKAVSMQPQYQWAHSSLGLALDTLGRYERAEEHLKIAIELDPDDYIAWARLSNLYSAWQQNEKALEAQRAAVRCRPSDARLVRRLNEMLTERGSS